MFSDKKLKVVTEFNFPKLNSEKNSNRSIHKRDKNQDPWVKNIKIESGVREGLETYVKTLLSPI